MSFGSSFRIFMSFNFLKHLNIDRIKNQHIFMQNNENFMKI